MVKLTCKFSHNLECFPDSSKTLFACVSLVSSITQCTHPVNVLTTKLGIKIVCNLRLFL